MRMRDVCEYLMITALVLGCVWFVAKCDTGQSYYPDEPQCYCECASAEFRNQVSNDPVVNESPLADGVRGVSSSAHHAKRETLATPYQIHVLPASAIPRDRTDKEDIRDE
jgi:hypothetical protein